MGSDLIGEHPSPALSEQLKITLDDDARVDRIVAARVFREITRLAGHRTTDEFDSQTRYATAGVGQDSPTLICQWLLLCSRR